MDQPIETYAEFWGFYLRAHSKPGTRAWHFLGLAVGLALVLQAWRLGSWPVFFVAFLAGYGCAWVGHFAVEGNRPATFGHPLWSLVSDLRMTWLAIVGGLDAELEAAGAATQGPPPRA